MQKIIVGQILNSVNSTQVRDASRWTSLYWILLEKKCPKGQVDDEDNFPVDN